MLFADGKVYVEGIDFGELSTDGKLDRIVGSSGRLRQSRRPVAHPFN